jgi:putative acetyltransferase
LSQKYPVLSQSITVLQNLVISPLSQSEIDTAAAIWLESSTQAHSFIPAGYWQSKVDEMKNTWLPASETWILKTGDQYIGFYSLVENRLAALFLLPSEQGKGYGRILIEHAKSHRDFLELTVYEKNRQSIRFYQKAGFRMKSSRLDIETGEEEILMTFSKNLES